jgi:hypothetical protein
MRLSLEALEDRQLPSVSAVLTGTILVLTGSPEAAHNVLVRPSAATPGAIDVLADGQLSTFAAPPARISYFGGAQADTFTNRTAIPGAITLGDGANVVNSTAASTITAGNGNNVIQDTKGGSSITVGNGDNNIYGGPGDTIVAGSGQNIIYDILPGNTSVTVAPHQSIDHLFVGPTATLVGAQKQDHVARFFVPGRTIGSGTLVLDGDTLYFTADNAGDLFQAVPLPGNRTGVFTRTATGQAFAVFKNKDFNQIAVFGGSGNDVFINQTAIDDVMYGAGGTNVLIGGYGQLDLEKAGGAAGTASVAFGNSPVYNDLTGSGVPGTSTTLVANPRAALNILRSNSPSDQLFFTQATDLILSLYPDLFGSVYPGTRTLVR